LGRRTRVAAAGCVVAALACASWGVGNAAGWWSEGGGPSAPAVVGQDGSARAPFRTTLDVGLGECTRAWGDGGAGARIFSLHNTSDRPMTVEVVGTGDAAASGQPTAQQAARALVYAELEELGPGVTRELGTSLPSGHFHLLCLPEDALATAGNDVVLAATDGVAATPVRPAAPVTEAELIPVTHAYTDWVKKQLPGIRKDVTALAASAQDAHPGWRPQAERLWLRAHHAYLTLGAAYDAFGAPGTRIDGTADGLPGGAKDRDFVGFHRVESLLFSGGSAPDVAKEARALGSALDGLDEATLQVGALDLGLRAHEISEDIGRLTLTGLDDFGSHSGLDAIAAQNHGTHEVLSLLKPLLVSRLPQDEYDRMLASVDDNAAFAARLGEAHPRTAPAALPLPERQELRARLGAQTELLAHVATVTDVRRAQ